MGKITQAVRVCFGDTNCTLNSQQQYLPESYDNFLKSLNARNFDDLDWESVKGLLIEKFLKRTERGAREVSENALFTNKKGPVNHNGSQRRGSFMKHRNNRNGEGQSSRVDNRERLKYIECFKCSRFRHMAGNCRVKTYRDSLANIA